METEKTTGNRGAGWPILVATALLGFACFFAFFARLVESAPINPWEASIDMEGMRFLHGLPVYESAHATHMYGPLLTVFLAGIFGIAGLDLLTARMVFSLFGIALAAFMTWTLCRGNARQHWLLSTILFLAINFRTNFIFPTAQPDCAAALFAVVALWLWITRDGSPVRTVFSVLLFLGATFMKQTAAAFALIPIVHALVWRPQRWKGVVESGIPACAVLLSLVAVFFGWPELFRGMITVPSSLNVSPLRAVSITIYLLGSFPLFYLALAARFTRQGPLLQSERWIAASLVVLIPASIWTMAKSGGDNNSLLFAYLGMIALAVSQLDTILGWASVGSSLRRFCTASAIAITILGSFFFQYEKSLRVLFARAGDAKYDAALAVAKKYGPGLISPQDPTIAFRANGYFGRSFYFELDAYSENGEWPEHLPSGMSAELAQASAAITVKSYLPIDLFERSLLKNGFQQVAIPVLENSAYAFWRRDRPEKR